MSINYYIIILASVLTAVDSYGIGVTDTRYNWDKKQLSVCFASGSTNDKLIIKKAVEATWGKNSGVSFKGWGVCQGRNSDIRILLYNHSGSGLWPKSNVGNGSVYGISLKSYDGDDATYNKYKHIKPSMFLPSAGFCNRFNDNDCLKIVAVHEFGHALGLIHEQVRSDTPSWCDEKLRYDIDWDRREAVTTRFLTATWDSKSVMNYCSEDEWNNNGQLSQLDIISIQELFGPPSRRFIKNHNNGTVSCNTYCGAVNGHNVVWGDKAGYCVSAKNEHTGRSVGCDSAVGLIPNSKQLTCGCDSGVIVRHGNNGTISCKDFCKRTNEICVAAWNTVSNANRDATCDHVPGDLNGPELTCTCR